MQNRSGRRLYVLKALGNAFMPVKLRNGLYASQTIQNDADFFLGRILFSGRAEDVFDDFL